MTNDFELPDDFDPFKDEDIAELEEKLDPSTVKEDSVAKEEEKKKEPEFKKEDLLRIFDEIMFEGEYTELVKLTDKHSVEFRSRTMKEQMDVSRRLDKMDFRTPNAVIAHLTAMNMAYSMVGLNGKDFKKLPPFSKDKETSRMDEVLKLPPQLVQRLSEALNKFDRKIDAAMEEGIKNF